MKRTLSALLALLLLTGLCACGASSGGAAAMDANEALMENSEAFCTTDAQKSYDGGAAAAAVPDAAKRIYTANLELETTDFDDASSKLDALTQSLGGYFESSGVSNGADGYRYGSYTVRVPAQRFDEFLKQAGELCTLVSRSSSAEDVSEVYYDTQGRLKTQQIKLERLQSLLAKAEEMEDIITLENAISDTESQIESLSGELRHYDAQVDYSTVCISLRETYRPADTEKPASGFGERLAAALRAGWSGFGAAMQGLLVALAYGWMWLLLLAAALLGVRALRRRRKQRGDSAREVGKPEQPGGDKTLRL